MNCQFIEPVATPINQFKMIVYVTHKYIKKQDGNEQFTPYLKFNKEQRLGICRPCI